MKVLCHYHQPFQSYYHFSFLWVMKPGKGRACSWNLVVFPTWFESKNRVICLGQFWRSEAELLKQLGSVSQEGAKLEKILLNKAPCEQTLEIVNSKGGSFLRNAFYWLCMSQKNPVICCLHCTLPWGPRGWFWLLTPAGTAEHWERSCSQKGGQKPSGCRRCW